ncbi:MULTISPECIES: VOC family protein [Bacillus]|uniref:VOC family protein n=1 Tax=Bacillus TaxID=1386 RepID=UPI0002E40902|nr:MULTISPECIES: VOC family protein [Bacillus]
MSFTFTVIDHIQLAAPKGSEEKARAFYHDILGFEEIEKPFALKERGGVWFGFNTYQIHIGIDEAFSPAKKAHPAFAVYPINELKKHLEKNNVEYTIDDKIPDVERIFIEDPFGNRIEFLERI